MKPASLNIEPGCSAAMPSPKQGSGAVLLDPGNALVLRVFRMASGIEGRSML